LHETRQTFQSLIVRHNRSERRTDWRRRKTWRFFVCTS